MYKAALIGCGHIGSLYAEDARIQGIYTHAEAYVAYSETTLVGVCDTNKSLAQKAAKKWSADTYTDIASILKGTNPDIVSICTPDHTHAEILDVVLNTESVKAIVAEKPLALDVAAAKVLVERAAAKGVFLAVNYSRRYSKGHQKIKKLLVEGLIGSIQKVSGFYTKGVMHNGTHWLDLARWLIGEVKSVQGFKNNTESYGKDPTLDVQISFENGVNGVLLGLDASAFSLFEMDILGSAGRIRIKDSGHQVEFFNVIDSPYYSGYKTLQQTETEDGDLRDTLLHVVEDVVSCLQGKTSQLNCSGQDGLIALELAHKAINSVGGIKHE